MNITNKTVLITGANRGIGLALVNEALRRGAKRVYAGTRGAQQNADKRVTPLKLDVTNASEIKRTAAEESTLWIFSSTTPASLCIYDDLSNRDALERLLAVNLYGHLRSDPALFCPGLIRSRGAIVNNLSLASLAPLPFDSRCTPSRRPPRSRISQSLQRSLGRTRRDCPRRRFGPHRY